MDPSLPNIATLVVPARKSGEDRARVSRRGDHSVIAVADGAGGVRGGARAAQFFVDSVASLLEDETSDLGSLQTWTALFRHVDSSLARSAMGETTGVVVVLGPFGILGVAVGNSQAWLVGPETMDDLTAGAKPSRLGTGRARPESFVRMDRPWISGRTREVLILGTDGLFDASPQDAILEVLRGRVVHDPREISRLTSRLVELARLPSGALADDTTVIVAIP